MTDPRPIARCVLMLAAALACTAVPAQETVPSAAAAAAAEKAQKTADRTMYWIRVLAQTPAPKVAAAPRPAPAVAATAASTRPVLVASRAPAPAPPVDLPLVAAAPSLVGAPNPAGAISAPGLNPGVASAGVGVAAGLVAPTLTAPAIAVPPVQEEPDPGLVMVKSADPEFPMSTMRRLRKGEVEVKFEVGPDGLVSTLAVTRSTSPSLNAAAMDAVRQWRFKPTPKGHTALVALAFNLDT